MNGTIDFLCNHINFILIMLILNYLLVRKIVYKIEIRFNKFARDALGMGPRMKGKTIYTKFLNKIMKYLKLIENSKSNTLLNSIVTNSKIKIKQAGFKKIYSLYIYIFFQYINPLIGTILAVFIRRNLMIAALFGMFLYSVCKYYVYSCRRNMIRKFEKHTYIIYKYLNNQISSGMRVIDAIKSVYLIVSDKDIRMALVRLASQFELTNNIDSCLEDFKQRFECEAAETMAVALKQGIETGDSSRIIARQERKMFQRFIYQIKLETDMAKFKSFYAIAMFCGIISIMIIIPIIGEIQNSLSQILIN